MKIAYTKAPGKGDMDALLAQVADVLAGQGLKACGTVQINSECASGGPCDMDVRVLPDGPVIRISQSLGKDARGCRLDPDALEQAIALSQPRLYGSDVLIVNKFGKHEASGRGFRDLIAQALSDEIPVVVGLNALNEEAFTDFTGGIAEEIAPDAQGIAQWVLEAASDVRVATTA